MNWIQKTIAIVGITAVVGSIAPAIAIAQTPVAQPDATQTIVEGADLLELAREAFAVQDYQNAVFHSNRALELNPGLAQAYLVRGQAEAELGDRDAAIADIQQAAALYREQNNTTGYSLAMDSLLDF